MIEVDTDDEVIIIKDGDKDVKVEKIIKEKDGKRITNRSRNIRIVNRGQKMSREDMDAIMEEVRASLAEAEKELEKVPVLIQEALVEVEASGQHGGRTVVKMDCRGEDDEVAKVEESEGQVRMVYLCQARVMAHALKGLKEARKAIAESRDMTSKMRKEVLRSIDEQIEAWEDDVTT